MNKKAFFFLILCILYLYRYLFSLQMKRDLMESRLICTENTGALLASHLVQCTLLCLVCYFTDALGCFSWLTLM